MNRITRLTAMILSLLLLVACGATAPEPSSSEPAPPTAPVSEPANTPPPTAEPSPPDEATEDPIDFRDAPFLLDTALNADYFNDVFIHGYDALCEMFSGVQTDHVVIIPVQYTGEIIEVLEEEDYTEYLFAIDSDYDKIIYVQPHPECQIETVAEGDHAKLYGIAYQLHKYETESGVMINYPAVLTVSLQALPEYPTGPVTIQTPYNGTIEIESFAIVNAEIGFSGDLFFACQVTGTVSGSDYLVFDLKCYDKDDIFIGNASIFESVSDGEKFRIIAYTAVPIDTTRVEFKTN